MKTQIISKLKVCILLFSMVLAFSSCSDDDKAVVELPIFVELPASTLGWYNGLLTLNGILVNSDGTAWVTASGSKTYTISFSDDVSSITGATFITNNDSTIFTYINANATTTVTINVNGDLTVAKSDVPIIAFDGSN
ncbi:hypothetical protein [Aquimarina sp. MMG016]|uniref:hypothetical protein n=1 Tax=Aquimarina sp. MMG016 TaxID=2822690 RepID=UPI001B3A41C4|nr:hypothetical protein [Aquimarina sp. MMG016]MBQ4821154.1 hypothetical protein [Aquimarina sp. MMG016]